MLCSKLHCQTGFKLKPFFYDEGWWNNREVPSTCVTAGISPPANRESCVTNCFTKKESCFTEAEERGSGFGLKGRRFAGITSAVSDM